MVVWAQLFPDRPHLMLQWHDPETGKSRTAGTCNPPEAEKARADLEYELNHGLHVEPSRMTWERFSRNSQPAARPEAPGPDSANPGDGRASG